MFFKRKIKTDTKNDKMDENKRIIPDLQRSE